MFSIIIPSLNNLNYLKICINSLKKNSKFNHEIIVHVNIGNDGTIDYLKKNEILYTFTNYNAGICEGINLASKKASKNFILYSHDDFYFCPNWDVVLKDEISIIKHNKFYLSGTMFGPFGENSIYCGDNFDNFDEEKLLSNFDKILIDDFQGSTWAPHVIHKEYWEKVGGFSEEFFPGAGSDPDLNFKLWNKGIRLFKGLGKSKVYHFGSKTLRREKNSIGSKSGKIFLLKWGITISFFKRYYLKSRTIFDGPLSDPKISTKFLIGLFMCKIRYYYLKILNLKKYVKT